MKVLVVDHDHTHRVRVSSLAAAQGHEVCEAADGAEALDKLGKFRAEVLVTDVQLPGMGGLDLLKRLRADNCLPPTILMASHEGAELALSAVRELGGFWHLEKPVDSVTLHALLERAGTLGRMEEENRELRRALSFRGAMGELAGQSPAMRQVFAMVRQVAPTSAPVFLTGEAGTGKEAAARTIHCLSKRRDRPFVVVNAAEIPAAMIEREIFGHEPSAGADGEGCLEHADGGTIFFDEVSEMPVGVQAKLLRVIEEFRFRRVGGEADRQTEVRVIAAMRRNPAEAIRDGTLREDLFYRLNVFSVHIPPLRERMEDLPLILETLIENANARYGTKVNGWEPEVLPLLEARRWEGNLRDLRTVIDKAATISGNGPLKASALSESRHGNGVGVKVGDTIDAAERALIEATLRYSSNNKTRAAGILGISTKTLHAKLKQYRLDRAGDEKM